MPLYSYKDLRKAANVSHSTLLRRLKASKFKKESPGILFTEDEARQIAAIIGITFPVPPIQASPSR